MHVLLKNEEATLHWYVSPNQTCRQTTVLANHAWQEAPLLLALHWEHVKVIDSMSQDPGLSLAFAHSRNILQWQHELQLQEPGILPVKNVHLRKQHHFCLLCSQHKVTYQVIILQNHQSKAFQRNRS